MELLVQNVTKNYKTAAAVSHFTSVFPEGVYALLGPNGSGKTTLLRMICGILRPSEGHITLDGSEISALGAAYRELLGYLPQNFGYYPNFTGWDFMMYFAALKGLPKCIAKEKCAELLNLTGLYAVRKKKLKTYSGGMLQRLGIAQSLINSPKILVLDEPTAGLDPKERTKFRNIISEISDGHIILYSTHIVSDIEYIADTILLMKDGKLLLYRDRSAVCDTVLGKVWLCMVKKETIPHIRSKYVISGLRHGKDTAEVRIVSDQKPFDSAFPAVPTLEDLYLYYFRGEVS